MNLKDCLPHLLHSFSSESDLLKAIEEISVKFTQDRNKLGDYLKDPRLVSAYTAFYLTTNMPKLEAVMKWLPENFKQEATKATLVDLGAGPGTFSLAWKELFPEGSVIQVETSEVMKKQAKKLWEGLHPEIQLNQNPLSYPEKSFLLFGHSANEMGVDAALSYVQKIRPEHILFLEPGTKEFFPKMLRMRSELVKAGFEIVFPCPSPERCPMEGTENWCHQYLHVSHSVDVERLTQLTRKDRRNLPLTVQAFSKSKMVRDEERVVRVFPETKFSFEWEVCRNNELRRYQVMKRPYKKDQLKALENVTLGDAVSSEIEKELEGSSRVKITDINHKKL